MPFTPESALWPTDSIQTGQFTPYKGVSNPDSPSKKHTTKHLSWIQCRLTGEDRVFPLIQSSGGVRVARSLAAPSWSSSDFSANPLFLLCSAYQPWTVRFAPLQFQNKSINASPYPRGEPVDKFKCHRFGSSLAALLKVQCKRSKFNMKSASHQLPQGCCRIRYHRFKDQLCVYFNRTLAHLARRTRDAVQKELLLKFLLDGAAIRGSAATAPSTALSTALVLPEGMINPSRVRTV